MIFFSKIIPINNIFNIGTRNFSKLQSKEFKEEFLEHLHNCDFSINDLELVENEQIDYFMNQMSGDGGNKKVKITDLILLHQNENKLKINFNAESIGTKKFIHFFYHLSSLNENSIILIDELENSFNLEIIIYILEFFKKEKIKHQLLFTTHSHPVLNYLRSDQIKIIEKDRKNSSTKIKELYDLVSSNLKIRGNYGDYYFKGYFGARPNIISQ